MNTLIFNLATKQAPEATYGNNPPSGTTLLEHYAGMAMQGLLASGCSPSLSGFASFEHWVAVRSVAMAKLLISELEKESP